MKRLIGYVILGVIGYYLWRNHFKRLFQPKDQVKEVLEEVRLKNEIGDNKRSVFLANQVPVSTIGDTPYAGTPLTAFTAPILREPKDLVLLPKGGNTSKNPFDRVLSWLNVIALLLTVCSAGAAVPMTQPNTNVLSWTQWQFWDDFNKPLTRAGIMPASPSGHSYRLIASTPANTNGLVVRNGRWFMNQAGALYMSVSNSFHDPGGAIFGTPNWWTRFQGVIRYSRGSSVNGVERNLGFILSSNANFVATPKFLHIGLNARTLYVERELTGTYLINEDLPNPFYGLNTTYLIYGTNYPFSITIVSNTITIDYAGYTFSKTDPDIGTFYSRMPVLTIESTGTSDDQIYGEWESIQAGYLRAEDRWALGGPFIPGSTNFRLAGFYLEEGTTAARSGTATLSAGLATISTTAVGAKSRFRLQAVATANPLNAVAVTNIVNGTSFQVRSASNTDGNRVDWEIVEAVP